MLYYIVPFAKKLSFFFSFLYGTNFDGTKIKFKNLIFCENFPEKTRRKAVLSFVFLF